MFISFRPPKVGKYVAILFFILRGICSHTFFIFHSCMHELLAYQLHSCLAIHFRFSLFKYCDMIFLRGNPNINRNFDLEQILLSMFPPFALLGHLNTLFCPSSISKFFNSSSNIYSK